MAEDRNFDDIAHHFDNKIYGSAKGQIRLAILQDDLLQHVDGLQNGTKLRILDAGCGLGQLSLWLAGQGHELVLCDHSEEMLQKAQAGFGQQLPDAKVTYIHSPIQSLAQHLDEPFDLVLFHAVLEWLEEPQQILRLLRGLLKQDGNLSLLFYNRHSLNIRNLIRGNFRKVASGKYRGHPGSLTPSNPLDPDEVYQWLEDCELEPKVKTGIRFIYDYLSKELREQRSVEDILELERRFCHQEPYRHMGRYIHVLAG